LRKQEITMIETPAAKPARRGRTAVEINKQQKEDAERDLAKRTAAKASAASNGAPMTEVAVRQEAAIAAPDTRAAAEKYLDEVAPASIVGRMVKFNKEAQFVTRDDGEPIAKDAEFVALCDQTLIGWVRFNDAGTPPDRVMGLWYDNFAMPPRKTLGDLDQAAWELGLDGKPADPWQHHQYLVLQRAGTAELFTFVTSTETGRRAVGNLLRHFRRMERTMPGELPVVRLTVGGFNHRDPRVGWVPVPVFTVVGRSPRDSAVKPDTSIGADLNDELPLGL
jgi:hypothetical protein